MSGAQFVPIGIPLFVDKPRRQIAHIYFPWGKSFYRPKIIFITIAKSSFTAIDNIIFGSG